MKKIFRYTLMLCAAACIGGNLFAQIGVNPKIGQFYYALDETSLTCTLDAEMLALPPENSYKFLTNVTIPATVTYKGKTYKVTAIRESVFPYDSKLETLTFAPGCNLKTLYNIADRGFKYLKTVKGDLKQVKTIYGLGAGEALETFDAELRDLETIKYRAFAGCKNLKKFNFLSVKDKLKTIEMQAFEDCANLEDHPFNALCKGLKTVEKQAFWGCEKLQDIYLPEGLEKLGAGAIAGVDAVVLAPGNNKFKLIDGLLYNKDKTEVIFCPHSPDKKVTFPSGLKKIGAYAFAKCNLYYYGMDMTSGQVEEIGAGAFQECSIHDLTIPESVKTIGAGAFAKSDLSDLEIPESIDTIPAGMVRGCPYLKHVLLPASITVIEAVAFSELPKLKALFCMMPNLDTVEIDPGAIDDYHVFTLPGGASEERKNAKVFVPKGTKEQYQNSEIFSGAGYTPAGFKEENCIEFYKFKEGDLWYQELTDSTVAVTYENYWSPYWTSYPAGADSIVEVPESVTHLGQTYSVTEITENAFGGLKLKGLTLPSSIKVIQTNAFAYLKLPALRLPEGLDSINNWLSTLGKIDSVFLPASLKFLPDTDMFIGGFCESKYFEVHPDNARYMSEDGRVYNKTQNKLIASPNTHEDSVFFVPASVDTIGNFALLISDNLKVLSLPASIKYIGEGGLSLISNLDAVYCNSKRPQEITLHPKAFEYTSKDTLYVPVGTKSLYQNLDGWKEFKFIKEINIQVDSLSVNKTAITLGLDETEQLHAVLHPGNATNMNVTWSSADANIATVDENGVVTPVAEGTVTITVTSEDGNKTATCTVTVQKNGTTAVEDVQASQVQLYPNPSQGVFFVEVPSEGQLRLMNLTGQVVEEVHLQAGKNSLEIREPGMYLVHITGKDYRTVKKVLIQ